MIAAVSISPDMVIVYCISHMQRPRKDQVFWPQELCAPHTPLLLAQGLPCFQSVNIMSTYSKCKPVICTSLYTLFLCKTCVVWKHPILFKGLESVRLFKINLFIQQGHTGLRHSVIWWDHLQFYDIFCLLRLIHTEISCAHCWTAPGLICSL